MVQTIVCMRWGQRYGVDYVTRLWSMIRRHTRRPTRLVCYTDNVKGLDAAIESYPLPEIRLPQRLAMLPWRKISLWRPDLPGLSGETLYIDLDVIITGSLDDFFDYEPGKFCIIRNWTASHGGTGNTTCYRFVPGSAAHLFERMEREPEVVYRSYGNSQTFVSREVGQPTAYWPQPWCLSFKHSLMPAFPLNFFVAPKLPPDARLIAFTGQPDPDQALVGRWPMPAWKRLYKHVRPTPWIAEHWR